MVEHPGGHADQLTKQQLAICSAPLIIVPDLLVAGLFPHRSRPRLLTDATYRGLGSPLVRRVRRIGSFIAVTARFVIGDPLPREHSCFRTHELEVVWRLLLKADAWRPFVLHRLLGTASKDGSYMSTSFIAYDARGTSVLTFDSGLKQCYHNEVIGPKDLPPKYEEFNRRWGVPYGYQDVSHRLLQVATRLLRQPTLSARAFGPFGFQPDNNATRYFEYPWAYYVVPIEPGNTVVDLGGSLGGFQFVLSRAGAKVINIDPSDAASMGWSIDDRTFERLNRVFKTSVELRKKFLQDAGIASDSVDRIYCISTIEHIPMPELPALLHEMHRILKPGGFAVLTIDLFYDLAPFTSRISNIHGSNIDVYWLVRESGLKLCQGKQSELFGFPEFDAQKILSRAMEFMQGNIALNVSQALVLEKVT